MNMNGFPSTSCRRFFFLILGTGALITYNSLLSCIDYFDEVNSEVANVSGRMVSVSCTALFIVTILLLPISTFSDNDANETKMELNCGNKQHFQRCTLMQPSSLRVAIGFSLAILALFIFLVRPQEPNITALQLFCVFSGTFDAIVQSGLYVFAASYHEPTYSAAAALGTAVSGTVANILRLITKAVFQDDGDGNGLKRDAYISLWLCFGFIIIFTILITIMTTKHNQQQNATLE